MPARPENWELIELPLLRAKLSHDDKNAELQIEFRQLGPGILAIDFAEQIQSDCPNASAPLLDHQVERGQPGEQASRIWRPHPGISAMGGNSIFTASNTRAVSAKAARNCLCASMQQHSQRRTRGPSPWRLICSIGSFAAKLRSRRCPVAARLHRLLTNALLLAARYAPHLPETGLDAPGLQLVRRAIDFTLARHEPFPAASVTRRCPAGRSPAMYGSGWICEAQTRT